MFSFSIGTLLLSLAVSFTNTVSALPTANLDIARPRLSQLPKGTVYKYNYFDLGRGPPNGYEALVSLDSAACQVSALSPLVDEVSKAITTLSSAPEDAFYCQTSLVDPRCTGTKGTPAVLSLCAGYQKCLRTVDFVDFLVLLFDRCQIGGRVGGDIKLAEISNSPDGGKIWISHA